MRFILNVSLLVALLVSLAMARESAAQSEKDGLQVGVIKQQPATEGCPCLFRTPEDEKEGIDRFVFIASPDWLYAWVNVGGEDVSLKKVLGTSHTLVQKGSKFSKSFRESGIEVKLDLTVAPNCLPKKPCDLMTMGGIMSVTHGTEKKRFAVAGRCGC